MRTCEEAKAALAGVANTTHFYLHYQGRNNLELQKTYSGFVQQVMAAGFQQWLRPWRDRTFMATLETFFTRTAHRPATGTDHPAAFEGHP